MRNDAVSTSAGEVEIRYARTTDAEAIAEILLESFSEFKDDYTPEAFAIVTPSPEEIASRFDEGAQWLAVLDGEPAGTVSVVRDPDRLYIRSMAVLPAAQGMGMGRKLLDAVEKYAIDNKFERLFLYTTYFSRSAIRLYEKCGFRKTGDTTAEEWYGTPGLSMEKILEIKQKRHVTGS